MKLSLCTIAFNELPLMNVLDIAVEFGFDGVELWGKAPHMPHDSKPHYVEAVRMALDERNLELAAYGSYLTAGTDEFDAQMPLVLNIARWLGAQRVRVWAGNIGSANADESYRKHCVRDFQRLCDVGGEYGITFAIERHSHTLTDEFESALNLLEQINRENIGINYQRGHGATTEAVVHEIEAFGRRIINVHCHNVRRTESGEVAWDLHSGEIDYRAKVAALRRVGFDGYMEIEFVWLGDRIDLTHDEKLKALQIDCDFLRRLLHQRA